MYGFDSDDRGEGFVEIQTSFLCVAFDYNVCFVLFKNIVSIAFSVTDISERKYIESEE